MDRRIHVEPIKSPTSGIQEAIDSLQEKGGRVRIPAGRWHLSRSIRVLWLSAWLGMGQRRNYTSHHSGSLAWRRLCAREAGY